MANSSDFVERLREAIGAESERSFAQRAGIPHSTLRSALKGSEPGIHTATAVARAAGVSLDWLVSGEESPGPARAASGSSAPVDPHLYGVISGEVARVYKEIGMTASAHTVGEEAAKIAAEITASGVGGDEALPAVRVLVAQLRRRLTSEIADPATRKRQG